MKYVSEKSFRNEFFLVFS